MKSKVLSVWVVALVICCVCGVSQAEISYDNASSALSNTDNTTLSWSHGIGGGGNRILVVGIAAEDDSVTDLEISSVTYDGVAMDLVAGSAAIEGTSWRQKTELYYLLESDLPASGTYTVVVTYVGNVPYKSCGAVSLAGVAQYAREAVQTNSNSSSNSISTNITTLTDGAWVVDVVGCGNPGSFATTETGMVERWDISASSSSAAASTKPVEFASTTTMGWDQSGANRLSHSVAAFAAATTSPYPVGDLNQDYAVDWTDGGIFFSQWLDPSCSGPACADLDGQNGVNLTDFAIMITNWTGPSPDFEISGYVETSGSSGISGVSVSADNGGGSDITDSSGYYNLSVPYNWSGRVTPARAGYSFAPSYRDYSNVTSNQTNQDYTGTLQTQTISGYVETSGSSGISGIIVSANNGGGSDVTDSLGYYSVGVPYDWSGRVTPAQAGYTFGPPYRDYSNVTSNLTNQDYTGTLQTQTISGYIETSGSSGISGVSVSANNGGGSDVTDTAGYYSLIVPSGWSGRVTPTRAGYSFSPEYRDYSNVTSDQTNQDYTGTPQTITIVINELMASNSDTYMDDMNDYDDWIELYNASGSSVDIGGMYITDDLNEPDKYRIPTTSPGLTTIPPGGYLILWADGEAAEGILHLDFQLSKGGEDVGLFESDLTPVDGTSFGEQVTDVSYGRYPNGSGGFKYMGVPTPDALNVDGYAGLVDEVEISHIHGFYDSAFEVELYCEDASAVIRYTTDGSTPTDSHGTVYGSRISITTTTCLRTAAFKSGWKGSTVNTATYIFLDDVKTQSNSNAYSRGFPALWEDQYGSTNTADYEVDPDIVNDPAYSGEFQQAMTAIPTLSIVTDLDNLFDGQTGIYWNPNVEWERPVSAEFIDPSTGADFQINAGLRMVGEDSQNPKNPKHTLRLFFRGEYGDSTLNFPLYPTSEASNLQNISLRSQYHWNWLDKDNLRRGQFLRDCFAQDTYKDMGYLGAQSRFAHVYINGLYWGLYEMSERPDEHFLSEHLGDDPERYDVIKGIYPGYSINDLKAGMSDSWDYLWAMIIDNDYGDPVDAAEYADIEQYLDAALFCDHIIYNMFVCNWDWAAKNWWAGSTRNDADVNGPPDTRWVFYQWDSEISMIQHEMNHNTPFETYYGNGPGLVHNSLHNNPTYNRLFADRVHRLLFNEGVLTGQKNIDRWEVRAEQIESAVIGESARWGDYCHDINSIYPVMTRDDHWAWERDRMINPDFQTEDYWLYSYFPLRTAAALSHFRNMGLYPSASYPAPSFSQHGGEISAGSSVTITGSGTIYYTTDSSEPINYGSPISSGSSVTIDNSLVLKARAHYGGSDWSALNEATFAAGDLVGDLRITEMMYHPPGVDGVDTNDPDHEFIELKNIGGGTINLNLVKLTEGVHFEFGNMTLGAGQHVLVVKNITAFESKYGGGLDIAGEWTGPRGGILSNNNERIRLEDAIGRTILDFSYNDGWRKVTDGEGFSLNIVNQYADATLWADKANWAASEYPGGTPGSDDSGLLAEHSIAINEVLAHTDVAPQDWIELKNTTSGSIDISGWYLSDSDENLLKYQIASGTSIGPDGYLVLTENDNFGPNSVDPGMTSGFRLSEHGETVYLTSSDGGVLTGYREQEDFGASENGVSFGRHLKSTGTYNFVAMSSTSFSSDNNPAKVGPIVINEIMYNPASGGQNEEYIELHNITGSTVNLYEIIDTNVVGWEFTNGIKYTFGAASIPANGYMLVVKTDPVYFKTLYSVPGGITVLGPYEGRLSNGGEKLELSKPGDLDDWGQQTYIRVDRVVYSDGYHPDNPWESDPWPSSPDAGGDSLNRKVGSDYGNDIANWRAATASPGAVNN